MSSTNEELSPPPKPRASPLDYRNTDLVSRLLAATPPYLYNMPLVPHSYFFSEMLRSFVQAKAQENRSAIASANNNPSHNPTNNIGPTLSNSTNSLTQHRRSRKRGWSQMKSSSSNETWQKQNNEPHKDDLGISWSPAKLSPTQMEQRKSPLLEKPLELTINKLTNNNKITHKISDLEKSSANQQEPQKSNDMPEIHHSMQANPAQIPPFSNLLSTTTSETPVNMQSDLMLPPPPPIWYPPIYPSPYGIDPLHFFIDLRVSGHIYDRKKEANLTPNVAPPPPPPQTTNFLANAETKSEFQSVANELSESNINTFKLTRHTSAFSVPIRNSTNNNGPINLSNGMKEDMHKYNTGDLLTPTTTMKTENHNKVSTHYVMQNLQKVYNKILEKQSELAVGTMEDEKMIKLQPGTHRTVTGDCSSSAASVTSTSSSLISDTKRSHLSNCSDDNLSDTSTMEYTNENPDEISADGGKMSKKNSNCKDLSALIGLELVVDYVKHEKPRNGGNTIKKESNSSNEPIRIDSPDLEIVEPQQNN